MPKDNQELMRKELATDGFSEDEIDEIVAYNEQLSIARIALPEAHLD